MAIRGLQEDIIENWHFGVITAVVKDQLPNGAIPSCKNGQFFDIGPEQTVFGTRYGCELQNLTAAAGEILTQYFLKTNAAEFHLVGVSDGSLKKLSAGTLSAIASGVFTNTTTNPSWETANQLAFFVNGTDKKKTDGSAVYKFGIAQPGAGDWSVSAVAGGASIPTGTYTLKISYYASAFNHEGPVSVTKQVTLGAGQKIQVTLPSAVTIADSQVDYIKIYLQQDAVTNIFTLVVAGTSPAITGTSGWAVGTATVDIDSSSAQILAFTILAPNVNDHYPPPTGATHLASHKQRMFLCDGGHNLFWSDVDDPESFNTTDNVVPVGADGEMITGLAVIADTLVIFKDSKTYILEGDDPSTWVVRLVDNSWGCVSHTSLVFQDGKLFWMSQRGPVSWAGPGNGIEDITTQLIGPTFSATNIDPTDLSTSVALVHPVQNYIGWAVTPLTETKNTVIVPFNYRMGRWMSSEWNMVDVRSAVLAKDSTGRLWPYIGDYYGNIYKVGISDLGDGVPTGVPLIGTVTSGGATSLTDTGAVGWTANTLIGRYVYKYNGTSGISTAERRKITANTTTTLTVDPAWTNNPVLGDSYVLGGIMFDWRSAFRNGGTPFFKKRIEFVFLHVQATSAASYAVQVYKDLNEDDNFLSRTVTTGSGGIFDVDNFDIAFFATTGLDIRRIPIRTVGYSWQTRLLHLGTGESVFILRNAVQWLTKTKKPGRSSGSN